MGVETERNFERSGTRRVVGAFVVTPLAGFCLGLVSVWVLFWPFWVLPYSPVSLVWSGLAAFLIVAAVFFALRRLLPARFRDFWLILIVLFVFAAFLGFVAFLWVASTFGDLGR